MDFSVYGLPSGISPTPESTPDTYLRRLTDRYQNSNDFYAQLIKPPSITVIVGGSSSGKTLFARSLIGYWLSVSLAPSEEPPSVQRAQPSVSGYNMYYSYAPTDAAAYSEALRYKPSDETALAQLFQHTNLLVMDDFDLVPQRYTEDLGLLLLSRSAKQKATVITVSEIQKLALYALYINSTLKKGFLFRLEKGA